MDCDALISLIEQCYERMCRKKRALCWNLSGALCNSPAEVICLIKNLGLSTKSQIKRGLRVATVALLVTGTIKGSHLGDSSDILGSLLACRVFLKLRKFSEEERHHFLLQRNILHALAEIKQWIRGFFNCENLLQTKIPLEKRSILQLIELMLKRNRSFSERCCLDLAHLLVKTAVQQKRLLFIPKITHGDMVYGGHASSEFFDNITVFDHAVLLPISLSLEARLLLLDAHARKGKFVLFSCSLLIEDGELEAFVKLLRSLQICFLASQRVIGSGLKKVLFELDVVPLERLSLNHSGDVQLVTGATPFHSLCEFILWTKSVECETENVFDHIGEVSRIVNLNDERIWIYGKGNIATVFVPIPNPFALSAIIRSCEEAFRIAFIVLRGFSAYQDSFGAYEAFFAEYLHYRYLIHPEKNIYLRDLVHVIRFTLLSYASSSGVSPDTFSQMNCFDVSKNTTGAFFFDFSRCKIELEGRDTGNHINYAAQLEQWGREPLWRFAELIWTAIHNASLLFCVKESI
ncbi:hypothetical protein ECC02_004362 [Trypanosoma cruzi]|uniref:Uncharacterized protein n=2 Tax=Trypanosoma cruzi TaxID=5693 RepID=Q4DGJ3_TRYCC|nr:hypothetical protein, conserved [Trypanosoma cruzi]EAN91651.1 hypothetical protein, conserved [Trypanosoma cruzi]KAF5222554.1 hypothetical protein ECC02_004362 [Trypanosoma cruzi]|eukprot:XP_813502.1 hypothetical protein [Trypanosoma cruzi strain CL Brener]